MMDTEGTAFAAVAETTSFLHYFSGLPDHRQASKVDYPLPEVLLLILLAVLAGAEAFTDIARFGERKIELLRRFPQDRSGRRDISKGQKALGTACALAKGGPVSCSPALRAR